MTDRLVPNSGSPSWLPSRNGRRGRRQMPDRAAKLSQLAIRLCCKRARIAAWSDASATAAVSGRARLATRDAQAGRGVSLRGSVAVRPGEDDGDVVVPVIDVRGLHKTYGPVVAVDGLDLSVAPAEIFGVVGPNGAGKTTTVECIAGLRVPDRGSIRVPDRGSIRVLGLDPQADRNEVRQRVGVQLQESAFPAKIRVREVLELFGSFYRHSVNVPELVDSLGLAAHTDAYYRALSGGLKQRLSIALALVGDPEVAVLDELTTGLDPHARQQTWALIESVCGRGVTVVVVTPRPH